MSQYGAYGYALHGADYRFILAHYYQGTALATTNPDADRAGAAGHRPARRSRRRERGRRRRRAVTRRHAPTRSRRRARPAADRRPAPASGRPRSRGAADRLRARRRCSVPGTGSYRGSLQFSRRRPAACRPSTRSGSTTTCAASSPPRCRPAGLRPALEAQAVAARTYAITTAVGGTGYDLYDDTRSQMYGGVGAETPATDAAVAATSGQIVTYDGAPGGHLLLLQLRRLHREHPERLGRAPPRSHGCAASPTPTTAPASDPYHRWSYADERGRGRAPSSAGWSRARCVGIAVTQHGVSPRIIAGPGRRHPRATTVSGTPLQPDLQPADPGPAFTTITTAGPTVRLSGTVFRRRRRPAQRPAADRAGAGARWPARADRRGATAPGRRSGRYRVARGPSTARAVPVPGRVAGAAAASRTAFGWVRLAAACPARCWRSTARSSCTARSSRCPDSITGADGHPVNALLGAVNLILRIAADRPPRAIVVCFGAEAAALPDRAVPRLPRRSARRSPTRCAWQFDRAPDLFDAFGWDSTIIG